MASASQTELRESSIPAPAGLNWVRWLAIGVFVLAASLNYLDRQLLAALAPTLKAEFQLSGAQYGQLVAVFSMVYAVMTPLAGLLVDQVGLTAGITVSVIIWSLAGSVTGLAHSFRALLGCRCALGAAEAAGIPCATKASATYLRPREFGFGTASQSIGITLGSISAPILVAAVVPQYGWRSVFVVCGGLGLLWVPLWLAVARSVPSQPQAERAKKVPTRELLGDRRIWGLAAANALVMTVYSLWTNWTTIYLVQERHLSLVEANRQFAWIPPIFATAGGFFGAALAFYWMRKRNDGIRTRVRICRLAAPALLATAGIPFIPNTGWAVAAIGFSFFTCMALLNNLQVIPIDLFGASRAAFSGAVLTCSYALMQMAISPSIGAIVDRWGFPAVCIGVAFMPLIGLWVLDATLKSSDHTVR